MKPIELFRFCPRCAQPGAKDPSRQAFRCSQCGLLLFFNPAIASAAFVLNAQGEALFIRRAKEPSKGMLALPGGFVDNGETAEFAVRREIREEVNLEMASLEYLCSQSNEYHYLGVTYAVLDLFFVGQAKGIEGVAALDGVESYSWLEPRAVNPKDIAFTSIRNALTTYLERENRTPK